jgi:hypothetical protein
LRHGNSVGVGKAARLQFSLFVRLWQFWKKLPGLSSSDQSRLAIWEARVGISSVRCDLTHYTLLAYDLFCTLRAYHILNGIHRSPGI